LRKAIIEGKVRTEEEDGIKRQGVKGAAELVAEGKGRGGWCEWRNHDL